MLAIIGPTASGKSNIVEDLVLHDGFISCFKNSGFNGYSAINFDSCQMYSGLELLKSTPVGLSEHYLYSYLDHSTSSNVFKWGKEAKKTIDLIGEKQRLPILVGGTGLYLKAFIEGINLLPEDLKIKNQVNELSIMEVRQKLERLDPLILTIYKDERRLKKALSYFLYNNESIIFGYSKHHYNFFDGKIIVLALIPKREVILDRIKKRLLRDFDKMVEEVRIHQFNAETVIGFSEIKLLLAGQLSKENCLEKIEIRTRQYAKRQVTFIKNCLKVDHVFEESEKLKGFIKSVLIKSFRLFEF